MKQGKARQFLRGQRKNNTGSSLVTVLAALVLVSILVVTILSLTAVNYQMKLTDLQAKKSFYSAETALDEVRMGLQQEVSQAFSEAYLKTMQSYSTTDESQRKTVFRDYYLQELKKNLKEPADASCYSVSHLTGYLEKTRWDDAKQTGARLSSTRNALNIEENGIILKNLVAEYTNKRGIVSQIKTDIILNYPDMTFLQSAQMPGILDYALIANEQFQASGVHMNVTGNAYLGRKGAEFSTASVTFENLSDKPDKGILATDQVWKITQGSGFKVEGMELWGSDILVDASSAEVNGDIYVRNDLLVCNTLGSGAAKPRVNVKISGSYYGYGNPKTAADADSLGDLREQIEQNPADYSSSIIVNGINADIDISGLNKMMLSGNAYIGASRKTGHEGITNQDIPMGESLALKSSQTAYLVPGECVAPGTENGGRNPMTAAQYQALLEETGGEANLVDLTETVSEKLGITLSQAGVNGYRTVCYPVNHIGSMVYLFMSFESEEAAVRFFDTYHQNSQNLQKLQEDLQLYTEGVRLPGEAASQPGFYYHGNVVVNDGGEKSFYTGKVTEVTEAEKRKMEKSQKKYQDSFTALGKKLVKEYESLTAEEKASGRELYDNLVGSFHSTDEKKDIQGEKIFISNEGNPVGAVLADGDYIIEEETVTGKNQKGERKTAQLRVVIAAGDVTLKSNFTGLIIAKGTIRTGSANLNITASPKEAAVALQAENEDGIRPFDYLTGMEDYMIGGLNTGNGENQQKDISELVHYENWTKQ